MQASPSRFECRKKFRRLCLALILYENNTNSCVRLCESRLSSDEKRKLVGALCRILDDRSRFVSRAWQAKLTRWQIKKSDNAYWFTDNVFIGYYVSLACIKKKLWIVAQNNYGSPCLLFKNVIYYSANLCKLCNRLTASQSRVTNYSCTLFKN